MAIRYQCVAEIATPLTGGHRAASPMGPVFGCVDWFLYDSGARTPIARTQGRDLRDAEQRRGISASEERTLMGYVR